MVLLSPNIAHARPPSAGPPPRPSPLSTVRSHVQASFFSRKKRNIFLLSARAIQAAHLSSTSAAVSLVPSPASPQLRRWPPPSPSRSQSRSGHPSPDRTRGPPVASRCCSPLSPQPAQPRFSTGAFSYGAWARGSGCVGWWWRPAAGSARCTRCGGAQCGAAAQGTVAREGGVGGSGRSALVTRRST